MNFVKRSLEEDTVPPMHPDWWWACAVSGMPPKSVANFSPSPANAFAPLFSNIIAEWKIELKKMHTQKLKKKS